MTDDTAPDEARRLKAVRAFQADQGRFPGILDTLRRSREAELAVEEPEQSRSREPEPVEL